MDWQGKRSDQIETSYIATGVSYIVIICLILLLLCM